MRVRLAIIIILSLTLYACSNAPIERQQYFSTASQAQRQWQQTVYHTTQFYGCGDMNFPCQPTASLRSTTQQLRS
ncbi:MAG: hypothetical protein ACK4PR_06005 [Gammaproteobacteria bacterium]